jgi:hypothetical protein
VIYMFTVFESQSAASAAFLRQVLPDHRRLTLAAAFDRVNKSRGMFTSPSLAISL